MTRAKKQTFYELDPRYFKDYSGNGVGDLRGLSNKIDYFEFLGVDNLILRNVLSSSSKDKVQNFTSVAKDIGDINDLKRVISLTNKINLNVFLEISIGSIKETHKWFANATNKVQEQFNDIIDFQSKKKDNSSLNYKYSKEAQSYYPIDDKTNEIPLNWRSEQVLEQFTNVIKFWHELGIKGFVFRDFEYVVDEDKTTIMSEATLKELRKFYRAIKEINDSIIVAGRSKIIPLEKDSYTSGPTQVFDYLIASQISTIGMDKKYGADVIGNFRLGKLAKSIATWADKPEHILAFGSEFTGRINSRWGSDGQYTQESAKALAILLMMNPASQIIYYGDEIGALNIGLTHLDDFQDDTLTLRKKELIKAGKKEREIMDAQVLQNPINAKSLMAWSEEKNGGFSNAEKTIVPVSVSYREINVRNQYMDKASSLLFYKRLIEIFSKGKNRQIITNGKFKISHLLPGVVKIIVKWEDRELRAHINLTNKVKNIKKAKDGKVILSTKSFKAYDFLPKTLDAYEAIIISKQTDEAFKETSQLKIKEAKETERMEIQKQKEAILKKEQEEKAKIQEQKDAEKAKADQLAKEEKLKAEVKAEQERMIKEEARKDREAEKKAKKESKAKINLDDSQEFLTEEVEVKKDSTDIIKEQVKIEKQARKELKNAEKEFSIMEEEVLESDRTTLTEDEIATTTQIDPDDFDDFEAFATHDEEDKK